MILFYYPKKDSTIYSQSSIRELNFGKSEILELRNDWSMGKGSDISRILLQFDIPFSLQNYTNFKNLRFYLKLNITQSEELTDDTNICIHPLSDEWQSGTGIGFDADPEYHAVNWLYKTDSDLWNTEGQGGGSYYTHIKRCEEDKIPLVSIYKFENKTSDVEVDVTDIVKCWILNDIKNNGFLVKFESEGRSERSQSIKFYSSNTNTIYSPMLKACYVDYVSGGSTNENIGSGSLSGSLSSYEFNIPTSPFSLDSYEEDVDEKIVIGSCEQYVEEPSIIKKPEPTISGDIVAKIKTIRKKYFNNEQIKFNVSVRNKNPIKTFSNKARYSGDSITDCDMFYSVRDAETHEIIIDYTDFSRISNSKDGHFFILDLSGLHIGRYYKIMLMIKSENGTEVFDDTRVFEIGS